MGVYIDMEMPTEGYIDVRIKCHGIASFAIADNPYIKAVDAVPVPPHGRLVDADKLGFAMMDAANVDQALAMVDDAPTIIPAEPAEDGK